MAPQSTPPPALPAPSEPSTRVSATAGEPTPPRPPPPGTPTLLYAERDATAVAAGWPTRIGDYEVLSEIARGGMGVVLEARQLSLGRTVALKMILAGRFATPDDLRRFRTEAEAAARLQHPGIVPVYEVGEHEGLPYFSMELVEGRNLAEIAGGRPLPPARAAAYVRAVADAVHHAHEQGILHRDLKPSNILVDRFDQPKVTDFGLAKRLDAADGRTQTGAVLGTPAYMSPEQAAGRNSRVDRCSDVYSLGAILYELLTGRPPFVAEAAGELLLAVQRDDPTPPRIVHPAVPRDLETICLKCLEKHPDRRFASAAELAEELRRFLEHEPIRSRPAALWERAIKWYRRRPVLATSIVVSIAWCTDLAGASLWYTSRLRDELARSRRNLYFAQMAAAQRAWDDSRIADLTDLLDSQRPRDDGPDLRGFEWYHLWRRCHSGSRVLSGHEGSVTAVAFAPDGSSLVSASADRRVQFWDPANGELGLEIDAGGMVFALALSRSGRMAISRDGSDPRVPGGTRVLHAAGGAAPAVAADGGPHAWSLAFTADERTLLAGTDRGVERWDWADQAAPTLLHEEADVLAVALAPDGRTLAFSTRRGAVRLLDLGGDEPVETLRKGEEGKPAPSPYLVEANTGLFAGGDEWMVLFSRRGGHRYTRTMSGADFDGVPALGFSPDGSTLAAGAWSGRVILWEAASRKVRLTRTVGANRVLALAWRPDGGALAVAGGDRAIRIIDPDTGDERGVFRGHSGPVLGVAFSPDGSRMASAGFDETVRLWDTTAIDGPRNLLEPFSYLHDASFSADLEVMCAVGVRAGSPGGDGETRRFDPRTGRELPPLTARAHMPPETVACSPDGRIAMAGDPNGMLQIWEGDELRVNLQLELGEIEALAISPDGLRAATATDRERRVRLWELPTGRELTALIAAETSDVTTLAFTRDSRSLAAGTDGGRVLVWSLADGRACEPFTAHQRGYSRSGQSYVEVHAVRALVFLPDGRLVSGATDGMVRVWDLADPARPALELNAHAGWVTSLSVAPDGGTLASGHGDGAVRLWDLQAGARRAEFATGHRPVLEVAFASDGRALAAATRDGSVQVWEAASPAESEGGR